MSAYIPSHPLLVGIAVALIGMTLLLAFAVSRIPSIRAARGTAWLLVVSTVGAIERLTAGEPPGFRMLALISGLLYAMKAVVSVEARASGQVELDARRWFAFAAAWPGMRPSLFAAAGTRTLPGGAALIGKGFLRLATGALLVAVARWTWLGDGSLLLATALMLPGLSLILHFGIFNVVAGAWRLAGVNAAPLFRAPLRSRSLTEFWGRRWNLAFSEMTALGVYRPLLRRFGTPAATAGAFLGSGLLHELAISLPVKAGFGRPSLYFALHGALMLVEGALQQAGWPVSRMAWFGRLWTLSWLILPLPLLFHRPFLAGVIWPLLGTRR